jgi:hypothetical protein
VTTGEADRLLSRAREIAADPFMQRMVREYDERRFGPERAWRRAEMAALEREAGAGHHPMITR